MNAKSSAYYNLHSILKVRAEQSPGVTAITAPDYEPLVFEQLYSQVHYVVDTLGTLGIGGSDRVAIVLPNGPDLAVTFLAVASGATAAPLNPSYREEEFKFYLSDLNAKALILPAGAESPALKVAESLDMIIISLSSHPGNLAGIFTLEGKSHLPGVGKSFQKMVISRLCCIPQAPHLVQKSSPLLNIISVSQPTISRPH